MADDLGNGWREMYDAMNVETDAHDGRECPACGYRSITTTLGEPTCSRCDWSRTVDNAGI